MNKEENFSKEQENDLVLGLTTIKPLIFAETFNQDYYEKNLSRPCFPNAPNRKNISPNVIERKPDNLIASRNSPKMREGRVFVEGKPENLIPIEKISKEGSESEPKWQCNMCNM